MYRNRPRRREGPFRLTLQSTTTNTATSTASRNDRLSRPERKALERRKKQAKEEATRQLLLTPNKHNKVVPPLADDCSVHDILRRLQKRYATEDLGRIERRLQQLLLQIPSSSHEADDATTTTTTTTDNSTAWGQLAIAGLYQPAPAGSSSPSSSSAALVDRCLARHERAMKMEIRAATAVEEDDDDAATAAAASIDPQQSAAIPLIRALMGQNRTDDAWQMWERLTVWGKQQQQQQQDDDNGKNTATMILDLSNAMLSTIATYHFRRNEPAAALRAMGLMTRGTRPVESERWVRLAQAAAACQTQLRLVTIQGSDGNTTTFSATMANKNNDVGGSVVAAVVEDQSVTLPPNVVHSVLMARFRTDPSYLYEPDPTWYELIQNALVRRVVFVTGAVTLAGCPPRDDRRGEAVFIGRSNVGKSSLINLLTNRKSLAYTSKRPGKTQQYNYFAVNDKPRLDKQIKYGDKIPGRPDRDHFYIVDVPGFGYAAVPGAVRDGWKDLWRQYCVDQRPSVIFHLMDGRHGPTADDVAMSQMIHAVSSAKYVVVLTKVDKNGKFQVSENVQRAVHSAVPEGTPVVWTSAERRWGFDVLWKYLQTAIKT